MEKKYPKKPTPTAKPSRKEKGVFACIFCENKRKIVATSRRFLLRKKATALVTLAWSAVPQHTLVLASYGVNLFANHLLIIKKNAIFAAKLISFYLQNDENTNFYPFGECAGNLGATQF